MEERVTHTREARGSLQLRHNETVYRLGTTQQELVEAISATTRAQEAEALKDSTRSSLEISSVQRQLMLPPSTTPAYSSSSMHSSSSIHNPLAFPPLTPASGMSTQELWAPTTYQAGSHTDQRGTSSGSSAMNAMYAGSEDRHPRQRSGSKDRHHRDRGSSDDRHRRQDSGSDYRYHRMTDILVSVANLRMDIVGRGADLVTVIIGNMITPTTDIATSRDL